jgi:hypothetical protein
MSATDDTGGRKVVAMSLARKGLVSARISALTHHVCLLGRLSRLKKSREDRVMGDRESCCQRPDHFPDAEDPHHAFEVVGQHMKTRLSAPVTRSS